MTLKRIIFTILLITWMGIIFIFSNQNGKSSKGLSDKIVDCIIDIVNVKEENKENVKETLGLIIRKGAHFTEYFILGLLCFLTFKSYNINNKLIIISICFSFIYACTDEFHQLFLDGRYGQFIDVIIDTCGSISGILLLNLFNKNYK